MDNNQRSKIEPNEQLRLTATRRVVAKEKFRNHLLTYLAVVGLQVAVWLAILVSSGEALYFWPVWVAFGWGIGLFFEYQQAYAPSQPTASEHEQAVEEEMRRMSGNR